MLIFPTFKKLPKTTDNGETWLKSEQYWKQWQEGSNHTMETIIWGTHPSQKQQHTMTPISIYDEQLIHLIAKVLNRDVAPNYEDLERVKNKILPRLNELGICFSRRSIADASIADARPNPIEDPGVHPTTHTPLTRVDTRDDTPRKEVTTQQVKDMIAGKSTQEQLHVRTYRFGMAIEFLEMGKKMARAGWNGKNLFVYYVPAAVYPAMTDVAKAAFGEYVAYESYFAIKNARGTVSTWAPSINDCLAKDWYIVE